MSILPGRVEHEGLACSSCRFRILSTEVAAISRETLKMSQYGRITGCRGHLVVTTGYRRYKIRGYKPEAH